MRSVEKMGLPRYDENEGETFDLSVLYEGIHIKEKFLKTFAQEPETMVEVFQKAIRDHMNTCPRNTETGRPSCREKFEEYRLKQQSLIE